MSLPAILTAALLAAGILVSCHGPAQASAAPPPAADFFDTPTFSSPLLSPDGRYLAAKVKSRTGRDALAVVNLADNTGQLVASFNDADVGHVQWINGDSLLFDSTDSTRAPGDRHFGPGLYAVSRDGTHFRQLADRTSGRLRNGQMTAGGRLLPWHTFMLDTPGPQDSEFVYVASGNYDHTGVFRDEELLRLNTANGKATPVGRPAATDHWMLDQRGEPRLAASSDKDKRVLWLRDPATNAWRTLASFAAFVRDENGYSPIGFGPDGTLYAVAGRGRDLAAIYTVDRSTGTLSAQPVLQVEGYDFSGSLVVNDEKVLGIRYLTDTWGTAWFDPALKAVQADVDRLLPDTVNLIDVARRPDAPNVLVTAFSDVQSPIYYVYNRGTHQLNRAGAAHERLAPAQMGHQQWVTYKARDGLAIPALITLPAGTASPAKKPMVVLVHGGPWVRGATWGWRAQAQFLASRGYVVLEPEFRGSTGYGQHHFSAGLKQWGRAMQDDLADGTRWAIAQGYADPSRVCIAGASYGGYATLMGLVRDPDLYRCGIEWAGVTDLDLLAGGAWHIIDDLPAEYRRYGVPQLIGDPQADPERWKSASPIAQAARIEKPLLMAHGGIDQRVPLQHGTRLRDAIRAAGGNVEWIEYEGEGHGWAVPTTRIDFWTRVEAFLGKQLR